MSAIKATFHTARPVPSRGVVSFVFDVPTHEAGAALALLGGFPDGGTSVWVGIAPLKPEAAAPKDPKTRYAEASDGEQAVTRAALLCSEEGFQKWLDPNWRARDHPPGGLRPRLAAEHTAAILRETLGISSRAVLATDPDALARFVELEARFNSERRFGPHATR